MPGRLPPRRASILACHSNQRCGTDSSTVQCQFEKVRINSHCSSWHHTTSEVELQVRNNFSDRYPATRPNHNCWGNYFIGNSINRLLMHAKSAHYGTCRKKSFILYVLILHLNSLVSIDTSVWTLKTFPGIFSNASILKVLLTCRPMYCDTLWHNCKNLRNIPWWKIIHS